MAASNSSWPCQTARLRGVGGKRRVVRGVRLRHTPPPRGPRCRRARAAGRPAAAAAACAPRRQPHAPRRPAEEGGASAPGTTPRAPAPRAWSYSTVDRSMLALVTHESMRRLTTAQGEAQHRQTQAQPRTRRRPGAHISRSARSTQSQSCRPAARRRPSQGCACGARRLALGGTRRRASGKTRAHSPQEALRRRASASRKRSERERCGT